MSTEVITGLFGLLGAAIGASASIWAARVTLRGSMAAQLKVEQERKVESERIFQRETLLAVQEAVSDCARVAARRYFEDKHAYDESMVWNPDRPLSAEINTATSDANRKLLLLEARITNNPLRHEVDEFRKLVNVLGFESLDAEWAHMQKLSGWDAALQERLGTAIRELSIPYDQLH